MQGHEGGGDGDEDRDGDGDGDGDWNGNGDGDAGRDGAGDEKSPMGTAPWSNAGTGSRRSGEDGCSATALLATSRLQVAERCRWARGLGQDPQSVCLHP